MSDDEADPELLELLRQSLGLGSRAANAPPTTGVLKDAEYICDNSIDVAISPPGTKAAAESVWRMMQEKRYSTQTWSDHELHPKTKDEDTINFIFTMNLLNFSFWSEKGADQRFSVEYKGQKWTGYWSLVAALQRALEEGYPITTPSLWDDPDVFPDSVYEHIFRSATDEPMPLLSERIAILREAGDILLSYCDGQPIQLIHEADGSAAALVNLLVKLFPNFQDTTTFHGKQVRLYKRAQIMVADLWACFNNQSPCKFDDIAHLTIFPDYRIPQMLQQLGVLLYSPRLESMIRNLQLIPHGSNEEVEIRGCSIWAVELLRREIVKRFPEANAVPIVTGIAREQTDEAIAARAPGENSISSSEPNEQIEVLAEVIQPLNAVLIDFFLYDTAKERERQGKEAESLPHHRTRSVYY